MFDDLLLLGSADSRGDSTSTTAAAAAFGRRKSCMRTRRLRGPSRTRARRRAARTRASGTGHGHEFLGARSAKRSKDSGGRDELRGRPAKRVTRGDRHSALHIAISRLDGYETAKNNKSRFRNTKFSISRSGSYRDIGLTDHPNCGHLSLSLFARAARRERSYA